MGGMGLSMNWDLIRIGLPNSAAVLALALVPIVAMAFGPTPKEAMRPQTTSESQTLIANVESSKSPILIIQPRADAASPF
jgi:hypothetical protein